MCEGEGVGDVGVLTASGAVARSERAGRVAVAETALALSRSLFLLLCRLVVSRWRAVSCCQRGGHSVWDGLGRYCPGQHRAPLKGQGLGWERQ